MADNPFTVQVPNAMQALLLGQQAYKQGQDENKAQALDDARKTAVQAYQSGDAKGALATLLGAGDREGASLMGQQLQNQWTQQHTATQDARSAANDAFSHNIQTQQLALQKRTADRADDPTPDNFVADASAPGGYRPIGPADPAYKASVAKAEAMAKGDVPTVMGSGSAIVIPNKVGAEGSIFKNSMSGGLSDDALTVKANQWNNGDYDGATKNVGRGAQGGATLEAIANKAASLLVEKGMNPEEAAAQTSRNMQAFKASSLGQGAEARTAGVREANLNLILRAADAAIPAALQASHDVARTGFVPLNKIIQGGQVMTSDPTLKRFGMANLQLAEHWARAMNPTGVMRESDRDKALTFLSTADSENTYRQAVDQLHTQIVRERDAVKGSPVTPPAPSFGGTVNNPSQGNLTGAPQQPNVTSSGVKWSVQ